MRNNLSKPRIDKFRINFCKKMNLALKKCKKEIIETHFFTKGLCETCLFGIYT